MEKGKEMLADRFACFNDRSDSSRDLENNIADAGIFEIDLDETCVVANRSWVTKLESEHAHLARQYTG